MLVRWEERSIEAKSLINRERYQLLHALLVRRSQVAGIVREVLKQADR